MINVPSAASAYSPIAGDKSSWKFGTCWHVEL